jgi:multidrug transporter EmrE-like cation transporter
MADGDYRDIWISLAVSMPILILGILLFKDNPSAKGVVFAVTLIGGIVLRNVIESREMRRREKDRVE